MKAFAQNLKYFRKRAKLTQAQLAEKVNISYSFYVKLENSNNLPGWETLFNICNALNIPMEFLLRESGYRQFATYANYRMIKEMEELSEEEFALLTKNIDFLYRFINERKTEHD